MAEEKNHPIPGVESTWILCFLTPGVHQNPLGSLLKMQMPWHCPWWFWFRGLGRVLENCIFHSVSPFLSANCAASMRFHVNLSSYTVWWELWSWAQASCSLPLGWEVRVKVRRSHWGRKSSGPPEQVLSGTGSPCQRQPRGDCI